jgi:hypothetical protein
MKKPEKDKKTAGKKGRKADILTITGDWREAVRDALKRGTPPPDLPGTRKGRPPK